MGRLMVEPCEQLPHVGGQDVPAFPCVGGQLRVGPEPLTFHPQVGELAV